MERLGVKYYDVYNLFSNNSEKNRYKKYCKIIINESRWWSYDLHCTIFSNLSIYLKYFQLKESGGKRLYFISSLGWHGFVQTIQYVGGIDAFTKISILAFLCSFSEKAYLSRVAFYGLKGRYSKAILNCNEAIKIYPQSVRAYIYRGVLKYYNKVGSFPALLTEIWECSNAKCDLLPFFLCERRLAEV